MWPLQANWGDGGKARDSPYRGYRGMGITQVVGEEGQEELPTCPFVPFGDYTRHSQLVQKQFSSLSRPWLGQHWTQLVRELTVTCVAPTHCWAH